jgi:hypothetical protein
LTTEHADGVGCSIQQATVFVLERLLQAGGTPPHGKSDSLPEAIIAREKVE